MKYSKAVRLRDGRECLLREGREEDGQAVLELFNLHHAETDYLLAYPEENSMNEEQESAFLKEKSESGREILLVALVEGVVVGMASVMAIGTKYKVRHRADFGISVSKAYWGLGIGGALLAACLECAKKAGYEQLELEVVAENGAAVAMYKRAGFTEYGRNPKGFKSRVSGFQELLYMRKEL